MSTRFQPDTEATCWPWRRSGFIRLESDRASTGSALSPPSPVQQNPTARWQAVRGAAISRISRRRKDSMSTPRHAFEPTHWSQQQADRPGEMAQVERPPSFPSAGFQSRPDLRTVPGPQLPPLLALPTQQRAASGSGPTTLRLPPMEPSPTINEPPRQQMGRAIPVAQLLSGSPTSPSNSQSGTPASSYRPTPSESRTSPNEGTWQRQPHTLVSGHRLDQAPSHSKQLQQQYRSQPPYGYLQPPLKSPRSDPRESQYSPAPTSYSSAASYYDSQSETSSQTIAAPPSHLPPRVPQIPPYYYHLTIRQQPAAARACGFGERDRRVIDPPPILELKITDRKTGAPAQDNGAMLALHCTLMNSESQADETQVPPQGADMQSTRRLMGTLVASPYPAKDEHAIAGTFFVFPDLSCRSPGKYRLHLKLLRIDPMNMQQGAVHGAVAHIITDVFSVYTAKDFPGMRASSALLKALRRQGLNVGVKKGSEARKGKGKSRKDGGGSSSEDDDSELSDHERRGSGNTAESGSTGGVSPKTKSQKIKKRRRRES